MLSDVSSPVNSRLESLQPRLKSLARFIFSPLIDQDDLVSEMNLRILERSRKFPNLFTNTDSYILQDAYQNGARRTFCKSHIYLSYVGDERIINNDEKDGEDFSMFELIPSEEDVEAEIIGLEEVEAIKSAISKMSTSNQVVFWMLVEDRPESEIADRLGVTRSAVTQRKATIARHLAPVLA